MVFLVFCSIWSSGVCLFRNRRLKKPLNFVTIFVTTVSDKKVTKNCGDKIWIFAFIKVFFVTKVVVDHLCRRKMVTECRTFSLILLALFCHHNSCFLSPLQERYMGLGETPQNREDRILNAVFCLWCTPT